MLSVLHLYSCFKTAWSPLSWMRFLDNKCQRRRWSLSFHFLMTWWRTYKWPGCPPYWGQIEAVSRYEDKHSAIILIHFGWGCYFIIYPLFCGSDKERDKLLTADYHDRGEISWLLTRIRALVGGTGEKLPAQHHKQASGTVSLHAYLRMLLGPAVSRAGCGSFILHQTWALRAHINSSFFQRKIKWHMLGTHWTSSTKPSHFHACPSLLSPKQSSSRPEEWEITLFKYKYFFSRLKKKDSRVTIIVTSLLFNKKIQNKGFNEINAFRKKRVSFIQQGIINTLLGEKVVYYARHICVLSAHGFINILPPIHFPTLV